MERRHLYGLYYTLAEKLKRKQNEASVKAFTFFLKLKQIQLRRLCPAVVNNNKMFLKKIFWKILLTQNIRTCQKILGRQNILTTENFLSRQNILTVPKLTKLTQNILMTQKILTVQKFLEVKSLREFVTNPAVWVSILFQIKNGIRCRKVTIRYALESPNVFFMERRMPIHRQL